MLKLIILVVGVSAGAGGTAAWYLSSDDVSASSQHSGGVKGRLTALKERLRTAAGDGARAKEETETRLRREFEANRHRSDRRDPSTHT